MTPAQQMSFLGIVPLFLIIAVFYFFIIAPQRKQQKQHQEMLKKLKKNDAVVTIGGIHGVIVNVKEKTVVLRVDDNVKIEIDKSAISHLEKSDA